MTYRLFDTLHSIVFLFWAVLVIKFSSRTGHKTIETNFRLIYSCKILRGIY
jgi:hypothetical protein